jgi:hypothetical protein
MEQKPDIAAHWVHAFEEDERDTMVLRPAGRKLARSRGARFAVDLASDGKASIGGPGPADRPTLTEGRWSIVDGPGLGILRITSSSGATRDWTIVSHEPDRLVLRKER